MFTRRHWTVAALLPVMAGAATLVTTARADADTVSSPIHTLCLPALCGNSGVQGSGNLTSSGGPVESSSTNYLIFWGPFEPSVGLYPNLCAVFSPCPATGGIPDPGYVNLMQRFFTDLSDSSFYGMLSQYGAGQATVLGGTYVDNTTPYPNATSTTVSDSDIRNEVHRVQALTGWTGGLGHNFFVMVGPGEVVCNGSFGCSDQQFCSYHQAMSDVSGVKTPYAAIAYPEQTGGGCTIGWSPNGDPAADDAVNGVSHELFEMVTDPFANAWFDAKGDEIGDKCAWDFGTVGATGGNLVMNGDTYIVQLEYSNRISNCALS